MKRTAMLVLMAAAALATPPAAAEVLSPESAINKAGRQRMLSQRIVKAYCQIGLGVMPEISRTQLRDAVALFDTQLKELKSSAPGREAADALARLEREWRPFKALALGAVTRERAARLAARGERVLEAADRVTGLFEQAAPAELGRLINVAGRQRMLSQRVAKLYMLHRWEIGGAGLEALARAAQREFSAGLDTLRAAPENTPEIARELSEVALQWEWFQGAVALEGAYSYGLVVADASESMLASVERVTRLYEALARGK